MFSYKHLKFRYEPFPIGVARPVLSEKQYHELVKQFPPKDLFAYKPRLGNKYSLSEKNNWAEYRSFVHRNKCWRDLHAWIKSDTFVPEVMSALRDCYIDLRNKSGPRLRARFEFSMLPAEGGYLLPHTDGPEKVVTIVVSMAGDGEWNPEFGGGTDINRAKNARHAYNWRNGQAEFDEMEVLDTIDYRPNQAVVFVKTYNSWHSIRPMTGVGSALMRKTLTINIESEQAGERIAAKTR